MRVDVAMQQEWLRIAVSLCFQKQASKAKNTYTWILDLVPYGHPSRGCLQRKCIESVSVWRVVEIEALWNVLHRLSHIGVVELTRTKALQKHNN